jgi:hypothetical protein
VSPADSPDFGIWFYGTLENGATLHHELYVMAGPAPAPAVLVDAAAPAPTSNGLAFDSNYLVGTEAGLYWYQVTGGQRLALPHADRTITAIACDGQTLWSLECGSSDCSLFALELASGRQSPVALGLLSGPQVYPPSMVLLQGRVYVLGASGLFRVPFGGGAPVLVYQGERLPNFGGTLKPESLRAIGTHLYFGSACDVSPSSPRYSSVELDPATRQARWLALDASAPWVPYAAGLRPGAGDNLNHDGTAIWLVH